MLDIKLNIVSNCVNFTIEESTGQYDADINNTGWGGENPSLSDISQSTLYITDLTSDISYDGITYTHSEDIDHEDLIDYTALTVDGVQVNLAKTKIDDGIYCFQFETILEDNTVYNTKIKYLSICNLACRLKDLALEYINKDSDCCADCKDTLLNNFVEASALFSAIQFAFKCGKDNRVNKLINNLSNFLDSINCKNC